MTAAWRRVIGNPVCRARRSKRRLIRRETSWTRNPKFRSDPGCASASSIIRGFAKSRDPTTDRSWGISFAAMTALRQSRSQSVREGFLYARRAVGATEPAGEAFEIEIDNRGCVERQPLREQKPADNRDAERPAQLGTGTPSERDRHGTEQCREGRHHDRPKAQEARLVDRLTRALAFEPLRLEREIDHHDRVFLDDADQQYEADQRNQAQIVICRAVGGEIQEIPKGYARRRVVYARQKY